jgi:Tol biopolymer transport system component
MIYDLLTGEKKRVAEFESSLSSVAANPKQPYVICTCNYDPGFQEEDSSDINPSNVYLVSLDDSKSYECLRFEEPVNISDVTWSPNGEFLAFTATQDYNTQAVFVKNLCCGMTTRIIGAEKPVFSGQ